MAALGLRCTWAFSSDGKWGYSCHRAQAPGTRASVGALQNVGSSWTRDRTHVPCTGRWILNHWTTKEAQMFPFHSTIFTMSPALAGGFLTTGPPRKPRCFLSIVQSSPGNGIWDQSSPFPSFGLTWRRSMLLGLALPIWSVRLQLSTHSQHRIKNQAKLILITELWFCKTLTLDIDKFSIPFWQLFFEVYKVF